MRSVCFVNKFEFDFVGKVLQDAICIGDIDNDGESELLVGNTNGDLSIFKGEKLWQKISGLGMIASVAVGDVTNCGSNAVVTVSVEGWCHIYLCLNYTKSGSGEKLQRLHKQCIPANTKALILGDIQGDGQIDMILGLSDRVVRIYRWLQTPAEVTLVCLSKCESANQIGSICIIKNDNKKPCILVSQPGATYMTITYIGDGKTSVDYHVVPPGKHNSSNVSCQIIGNVNGNDSLAIASLNGNVVLIKDSQPVWSINVDHQTFIINKVNMCNDGSEQIVASSWSGHTFIIDYQGNAVCFELGTPIQTFISGLYSSRGSTTFIFVTFNNKILVYYDVAMESLVLHSLYALQLKDSRLSSLSRNELKQLTNFCLYNFKGSKK
ncbi:KICSTOR complex protein ITFG2 isoform X1 [Cimex lectularius]|uniref:Uncharacterized protein n=1 Tax=Cimex lectularius TaxID=79782 RepID=A0A8I6RX20_CIMLE|nr:KICSTOR complex protein ITFG2 isoform X1 [Cimex lectularius]XP_014253249.1 KICSTOR complex protein ITFG2 isoform X1 [Cimex lectularius]